MENLSNTSHKRYNILTGEWVLVSPHRAKRPWQGQVEKKLNQELPEYEANCYLCPDNTRSNGTQNPNYTDTFVFDNDFPALQVEEDSTTFQEGLFLAKQERGICRVICFSPNHSLTLPDMEVDAIVKVIELWQKEYQELGQKNFINYVQIFENKGAIMGCSNPHPHGQIWAQESLPNEVVKKTEKQSQFFEKQKQSLVGTYIQQEIEKQERIIYQNKDFVVLVPFWAVWPFETMIVPKTHQQHIGQMTPEQVQNFADALKVLTQAYDEIFDTSFPYSSGIHQSPTDGQAHEEWHWHMSFYPPLLRSATVKKFMVGYEMFAMPQRDITAESAARLLRKLIRL